MIITQLTEIGKNKVKVYLDGEEAFTLYRNEIKKLKLNVDCELSDECYHEIQALLKKRAKLRAMNLLQSRDYTTKQLKDKLLLGGYGTSCVEEAIDYVTGYHYLDDYRYAKSYIEYRLKDKTRRKLEQELFTKGISLEIINCVFDELSEEGQKSDEISMIYELLKKKKYNFEQPEIKEMQKMYGFLARKGFSQDAIYKVLFSNGKEVPYT